MCGISGFISPSIKESDLMQMTNQLEHRGPDAQGTYINVEQGIGLGHRRLSIIDLSETANQPLSSQNGRYLIVYNGELYNYVELRNKISSEAKIEFRTNCDTEVVIEAFSLWGDKCFEEFNGIYAMGIIDLEERRLTLARDRLGVKPLYFYQGDDHFAFASEIKSLKKVFEL